MNTEKRNCPYRRKCGACQTLNLTYDEELSLKMKREIELLGRFGHISEIIHSQPSEHYRNKSQYLYRWQSGKTISGLYRSSDGGLAAIDGCLMEDSAITSVYALVNKLIRKHGIKVFDGKRGELRHVMIRRAAATGEMSVSFITREGTLHDAEPLAEELSRLCPDVVTVTVIKNDTNIPLWINGEERIIRGPGYIRDELCGCEFRVPPKAFYQINPYSTEKLYTVAADFAGIGKSDHVLDAYCGIGTVGITAVKNGCASLDGFDINEDAVAVARGNAKRNGIKKFDYRCVSGSKNAVTGEKHYDVVFTDPPRSGCDRRFIDTLLRLAPRRIVYISCGPQSLARDLELLKRSYRVEKIQPVDMFPGTTHVETVVLMSRVEK